MHDNPSFFEERRHGTDVLREGDTRGPFQRDRARVVHSAAFRRLQGKTQVMGVGEGDFHRTRLTHSIECAQIGYGLLDVLESSDDRVPEKARDWLPKRDLVEASCFAHDLGHPPFGHGGEVALHGEMRHCGGFEGNGQTLRIISCLEKYDRKGVGIDPTRRLILAVLKYPVPYGLFDPAKYDKKPPKCYFDKEQEVVDWALEGFTDVERARLLECDDDGKAKHRTLDCWLMELADDIAYGVHDIEDVVARKLADREDVEGEIKSAFDKVGGTISSGKEKIAPDEIIGGLFGDSFERKQTISKLVNLFVTDVRVEEVEGFKHPLLAHRASLSPDHRELLKQLKKLALRLVVSRAEVQQLEQRGQRVVARLFRTLKDDPEQLIPRHAWRDSDDTACAMRRVCDYVAGMTDGYAEKVYRRLFVPGYGSSSDEL